MPRISIRERLLINAEARRISQEFRGSGRYRRALRTARVCAEHGVWHARLVRGEVEAAPECERLEEEFLDLMLESGMASDAALEIMERNMRTPRLENQFRRVP
jgi:hypothetical protein